MAWIWIIIMNIINLLGLAYMIFFGKWVVRLSNKHKKLPPGPKGFPIFGSLHLLGKLPHRDLHRLSRKYGPIMNIKLGVVNTIVVSSPAAAELFLKTHDLVFSSRPPSEALKLMSYGQKSMVFAKYGPYWRNMRKMCTLELLSNRKVNSFRTMRREELGLLIDNLQEAARCGVALNLTSKVCSLTANITCLMVFGKKFEDEELENRGFKWIIQEALKLAGAFNLGDYIPFLAPLNLQGFNRRAKYVTRVFDTFFEKIIDEHIQSSKNKSNDIKDFVDVMLDLMASQQNEYQIDRSNIKALMLDMFLAAMDTTSTVIGWVLAELIRHPSAMKKLQEELEKVVGLNRMVQETDLSDLKYLEMVVKEALRLHPPGPLLVPHESLEDCTVNGFYIPKKSRILVSEWAIGRDTSAWTDVETFIPERFIGNQVDITGKHFHMIPFGSGRRGCPGIQMGLLMIYLVIAQLVHCFDWKLPNGMLPTNLDITEEFGLTCPIAQDIVVIPIYRL